MNAFSSVGPPQERNSRQVQLVGILERLCQKLEPTETQYDVAKTRYEVIGRWIADSPHPLLSDAVLYPQGSFAIRTATRPLAECEYDVDLVAHMARLGFQPEPEALKKALGDRLREHATYSKMLQEMGRCWRLNYANEFHMDITPSIPNLRCTQRGELVPDKHLYGWKPSNPRGYRERFDARARLMPRLRAERMTMDSALMKKSVVEPFPEQDGFKGILRRIVQLAKRHRDIHFRDAQVGLAPISVIITTLASRSYETCVNNRIYDNELEILVDVVQGMKDFILQFPSGGRLMWFIENESTQGENFAEKWNSHPERYEAFFAWHARLLSDVERLHEAAGMDQVQKAIGDSFGQAEAKLAFDSIVEDLSAARTSGGLFVAGSGLTTAARIGAVQVKKNTFFGD